MTSKSTLYLNEKNEDREDTKNDGVFTEAQRKAVRKKLISFANKSKASLPTENNVPAKQQEKKSSYVPLLVDQKFHTSFNMSSYRPELDEIPHLLLFRITFQPFLTNKTPLDMEQLRFFSEMCGMEGTMIQEKSNGYVFTGEMPRGGEIKQISFYLTQCFEQNKRRVIIRDIVFRTTI